MPEYPLCRDFGVSQQDAKTRLAFMDFGRADHQRARTLRDIIAANIDPIVDEFYAHLMKFAELKSFLSDRQVLARLKGAQKQHLLSIGKDLDHLSYYESRLRVGQIHERVGLQQKWYLGAGVIFFNIIAAKLKDPFAGDTDQLAAHLCTLKKLLTLDISLAVETYHQATTQRLEGILGQLNEAQQTLQQISRLDGLTQINNRRFLMEALEMEVYRSHRFDHPLCLAIMDIDHFKVINDTHGHTFGDFCIQTLVRHLKDNIRQSDILGRHGGEEFAIGLVETHLDAALQILERARLAIALKTIEQDGKSATLTVSVGMAELTPDVQGLDVLMQRADEALYQAKESGRNRTCVWGQQQQSVGTSEAEDN
ncbi:MAG: diguanylate cyclase [Anaerolineaceae bacterium]|nr:diguanylate cyclase [Anaerolineaceae bacterium]